MNGGAEIDASDDEQKSSRRNVLVCHTRGCPKDRSAYYESRDDGVYVARRGNRCKGDHDWGHQGVVVGLTWI
jgi:hypothetical protein